MQFEWCRPCLEASGISLVGSSKCWLSWPGRVSACNCKKTIMLIAKKWIAPQTFFGGRQNSCATLPRVFRHSLSTIASYCILPEEGEANSSSEADISQHSTCASASETGGPEVACGCFEQALALPPSDSCAFWCSCCSR